MLVFFYLKLYLFHRLFESLSNTRKEIRHEALNITDAAVEIFKPLNLIQFSKLSLAVENDVGFIQQIYF